MQSLCVALTLTNQSISGFINRNPPSSTANQVHRYDNVPYKPDSGPGGGGAWGGGGQGHHQHLYQNHFFATIYDSDGANGFDPTNSFERQNSLGEHELEWTQVSGVFWPLSSDILAI